jgi:hypothetical protein
VVLIDRVNDVRQVWANRLCTIFWANVTPTSRYGATISRLLQSSFILAYSLISALPVNYPCDGEPFDGDFVGDSILSNFMTG